MLRSAAAPAEQTKTWKRFLYLLTFSAWFFYQQMTLVNVDFFWNHMEHFEDYLDQVCSVCLLLQIFLLRRNNWKSLIISLLVTALFGYSRYESGDRMVWITWLFIAGAADQDLDEVFRAALAVLIVTVGTVVVLHFVGLIEDRVLDRNDITRSSLGFVHPNVLGMMVQQMVALWIYLRRRRMTLLEPLLCLACAAFCFIVPNSRASVVMMGLMMVLSLYLLIAPHLPRILRRAIVVVFALVPIVSNLLSVGVTLLCKDTEMFTLLDTFLSGRLNLAYYTHWAFGATVFGNYPRMVDGSIVVIDNSFMLLILNFGIAAYVCYSLIYTIGCLRTALTGSEVLTGILAIYSIHAMMEKTFVNLALNVFLVALTLAVFYDCPCEKHLRQEATLRRRKRKKPRYAK